MQNSIVHDIPRFHHLLLLHLLQGSIRILSMPRRAIETVRRSDDTAVPCDLFIPMPQGTIPLLLWVIAPSLWIVQQVPDISPLAQSDFSVHSQSSCHASGKQESSCPSKLKFSWALLFDNKVIPWCPLACENLFKFDSLDYFQLRIVILNDCSILKLELQEKDFWTSMMKQMSSCLESEMMLMSLCRFDDSVLELGKSWSVRSTKFSW